MNLSQDKDVLLELYTLTIVNYCEATISVTVRYNDNQNNRKELIRELTIHFVDEHDMDMLEIDEQVLERVKEIANSTASLSASHDDLVNIQPRIYDIKSNEYAYLEKKYRVDY